MKYNYFIITILINFLFTQIISGQSNKENFVLHKLEFKTDSCWNDESSPLIYNRQWGKVTDINDEGVLKCLVTYDKSKNSNYRECNITLAGVDFINNKNKVIKIMKELLVGENVTLKSSQPDSQVSTDFEAIIEYKMFQINYSILLNGLGNYQQEKNTLDFWTACKYEEAVRIFNRTK